MSTGKSFGYLRCVHGARLVQRVRAYGELYSGVFLPGRADPDPSGSSRMSAPCGQVDA